MWRVERRLDVAVGVVVEEEEVVKRVCRPLRLSRERQWKVDVGALLFVGDGDWAWFGGSEGGVVETSECGFRDRWWWVKRARVGLRKGRGPVVWLCWIWRESWLRKGSRVEAKVWFRGMVGSGRIVFIVLYRLLLWYRTILSRWKDHGVVEESQSRGGKSESHQSESFWNKRDEFDGQKDVGYTRSRHLKPQSFSGTNVMCLCGDNEPIRGH